MNLVFKIKNKIIFFTFFLHNYAIKCFTRLKNTVKITITSNSLIVPFSFSN